MSLRINLNSAAMNAHRQLSSTDGAMGSSIEKLSSGFKINRAADDPAGLAISENLRAQVSGLGQAMRNSSDAVNMIRTAEGALSEVHSLLRSMRDLALHASNTGANDQTSIQSDQTQILSAISALNRISANTQFGNKKLLDGSAGVTATTTSDDTKFISGTTETVSGTYHVEIDIGASPAIADSGVNISAGVPASGVGQLEINGVAIDVVEGDTQDTIAAKINNMTDQSGVKAVASNFFGDFRLWQTEYGSEPTINISGTPATLAALGIDNTDVFPGSDVVVDITTDAGGSWPNIKGVGAIVTGPAGTDLEGLVFKDTNPTPSTSDITVTNDALRFQIGSNAGQTARQAIGSVAAAKLGTTATGLNNASWTSLADIDVTTFEGAQDAIKLIDAAISQISTERAQLGASQKDLEANINSLSVAKENISASESSIRDTDMAEEMVIFTKNQILMQAGTSMLTQANQAPQNLLSLLKQ